MVDSMAEMDFIYNDIKEIKPKQKQNYCELKEQCPTGFAVQIKSRILIILPSEMNCKAVNLLASLSIALKRIPIK